MAGPRRGEDDARAPRSSAGAARGQAPVQECRGPRNQNRVISSYYNTGKYRNEQYIATGEIAKYPLHTVGKGAVGPLAFQALV